MFVRVNMRTGVCGASAIWFKVGNFMSASAIIGTIMIVAGIGLIGYLVFEMIRDRKRNG